MADEMTELERVVLVAAKLNEKADRNVGQTATKEEWLNNVLERASVSHLFIDYKKVLTAFKNWNWRS